MEEQVKAFEFVRMCESNDPNKWMVDIEWDLLEATRPFVKPINGLGFAETECIEDPFDAYIELRKMFDGMGDVVRNRIKIKKEMLRWAIKHETKRHPTNASYPGRLMARIEYLMNGRSY